jgi:hypothetical protein
MGTEADTEVFGSMLLTRRFLGKMIALITASTVMAAQNPPKVIAWQAPTGPSYTNVPPNCLAPYSHDYFFGPTGHASEGFLSGVLPSISGIGVGVLWGCVDQCSTTSYMGPCALPTTTMMCPGGQPWDNLWEDCFQWSYLDSALLDYINNTPTPFTTKKIILIVQPVNDSGMNNFNFTPAYVFDDTYAAVQGWLSHDWTDVQNSFGNGHGAKH